MVMAHVCLEDALAKMDGTETHAISRTVLDRLFLLILTLWTARNSITAASMDNVSTERVYANQKTSIEGVTAVKAIARTIARTRNQRHMELASKVSRCPTASVMKLSTAWAMTVR
jgi:hypothetical protein